MLIHSLLLKWYIDIGKDDIKMDDTSQLSPCIQEWSQNTQDTNTAILCIVCIVEIRGWSLSSEVSAMQLSIMVFHSVFIALNNSLKPNLLLTNK